MNSSYLRSSHDVVTCTINDRHAVPAGSFADVSIIIACARASGQVCRKPARSASIEPMPAPALYDLKAMRRRALASGLTGIARLMAGAPLERPIALRSPIWTSPPGPRPQSKGELKAYPGSPLIARGLIRRRSPRRLRLDPTARKP